MSVVDFSEETVRSVARVAGGKIMQLMPLVCKSCDRRGNVRVTYRFNVNRKLIELQISMICGRCEVNLLPDKVTGEGSMLLTPELEL